jgi:multicomponent Na+:H+ antiporter subunit B
LTQASRSISLLLVLLLVAMAFAVVRTRSLLAAILLMSVYSLIECCVAGGGWMLPDVAFTEAVVGAGVSTIVLLGAILLARGETESA